MLQVFHVDVAKVDLDVAYVAMAIHVYCKLLFQMFQLFQTDVARILSRCCICFTLMLFHPDVAYDFTHMLQMFLSRCCICFAMATHMFPSCFKSMLQVFQLFWTQLQMFPLHVSK
jgi:hypothetical protein